jgi:hypothetical protein
VLHSLLLTEKSGESFTTIVRLKLVNLKEGCLMAQPLMLYASTNPFNGGNWSVNSTFTPTVVPTGNTFQFWPNLNEGGDNINPTSGVKEPPDYLYTPTFDSTTNTNYTFTRSWTITGVSFTATEIPAGTYNIVLTHAADNLYTATLVNGSTTLDPVISNQNNVPDVNQWRNAKTIAYSCVGLVDNTTFALRTDVTNLGIAGSTPQSNPAMFTWTLGIYS